MATNIGSGVQYELATDYTAKEVPTFVDTVISLFPQNLAAHWSNGEVVPIVVFCILVAVSYNKIAAKKPEEVAPFKKFIDAGDLVMGRVVSYVISFTPYAVLSLIARAVSPVLLLRILFRCSAFWCWRMCCAAFRSLLWKAP